MLQFYFPSQPQGRTHLYSCTTYLNIVLCVILLEGCITSKFLCISHCSVVGRWKVTETSSNNWYPLPFVSVFIWQGYNHWAENQNFLIKRTGGKIFSVFKSFKEVPPHRPGVTGAQRGEASLGAPLFHPVLSALGINITIALWHILKSQQSHSWLQPSPAHNLSLLLVQTGKTAWLMELQTKDLSSQLLQASSGVAASSWLKTEWLKKQRTPVLPSVRSLPHLSVCYCPSSSSLAAQMEMRWPNG